MKVRLSSCGNPDFRQDPHKPLPGVRRQTVSVKDIAGASRACLQYILENQLGGGNWDGGQVIDAAGAVIAQVSYNGRVWPPGDWTPEMKPLLE